ncbi:hypothetical protein DPMN_141752 [Dreissena polymorpha]|uniref:Uncharacterized protein n=1 Tax=Dreissena polymorpha TaxID=45954 RepID=A0A9D4GDB9_DREPO|nr:hypothetical protein DPMN_141752 [Dreissena polymorpha]
MHVYFLSSSTAATESRGGHGYPTLYHTLHRQLVPVTNYRPGCSFNIPRCVSIKILLNTCEEDAAALGCQGQGYLLESLQQSTPSWSVAASSPHHLINGTGCVAKQFAQSSILFPLCLLWWRATDIFWTLSQHTEKPGISEIFQGVEQILHRGLTPSTVLCLPTPGTGPEFPGLHPDLRHHLFHQTC